MKFKNIPLKIISFSLMVVMFFSLSTPVIVFADDNAGQGDGGTGGEQHQNNVDLWNDNKQGYRITILSEDGSQVICPSKDFVFSEPKAKILKKSLINKLGNSSSGYEAKPIKNNIPKPIKVVGNNYQANGDELKE